MKYCYHYYEKRTLQCARNGERWQYRVPTDTHDLSQRSVTDLHDIINKHVSFNVYRTNLHQHMIPHHDLQLLRELPLILMHIPLLALELHLLVHINYYYA